MRFGLLSKFQEYIFAKKKFHKVKVSTFVVLVFLFLVCTLVKSSRDEEKYFCSHSILRRNVELESSRHLFKRQISRHSQNRANEDFHARPQVTELPPEHQQEEQHLIDESVTNSLPADDFGRDVGRQTDARIDCARTAINSRPNRVAAAASNQAKDDCATSASQSIQNSSQNQEKVIETAVFIDQALENKFTGISGGLVELNKLVLNIMNQVQSLFRYSSMKIPIKIKLVLVEHLRNGNGGAPNSERGDIDLYLTNFCNWQQRRLEQEKKRIWWDHAILLSGLDLFKASPGKNHTGVLGLAWVGGMCKGNYSCTINEAANLESAFVIAHEIGHSLGIMHDGQRNNCDPNGFIMSERTGAGKVHWSRCSINYLKDSLQRRLLNCLETEQSPASEPLYDLSKLRPPGQVYTINDQCRLAFGSNYTSYVTRQAPFNSVCRELWCVAGIWAKAAHPALEGSACGDQERVCREGKCIK